MTTPNGGGRAFPQIEYALNEGHYDGRYLIYAQHPGMSLRDYFAGQALAALGYGVATHQIDRHVAKDAYAFADAMLAAREAGR
jgi:hypothetical protein